MIRWLYEYIFHPERAEQRQKAKATAAALAEVHRQRAAAIKLEALAKKTGCTQDLNQARAAVKRLTTEALRLELAR